MNRLKELRLQKRLSITDLHLETGIARSSLNAIENGKRRMNINHAIILSNYFKVPLDYILGLEKKEEKKINTSYFVTIDYELIGHASSMEEAKKLVDGEVNKLKASTGLSLNLVDEAKSDKTTVLIYQYSTLYKEVFVIADSLDLSRNKPAEE